MIIAALFPFSSRSGDVVGSWIFGLNPKYGFQYCVVAITVTYALILPLVPLLPKRLTATADGEPNPDEERAVLAEIREAGAQA
jgi:hypothetical protein